MSSLFSINLPRSLPIKNNLAGFSLVELSIVLVIIGLLTGGILSGQSLIRAAELRAVATEYEQYSSAIHTFRDKYLAIPGDMKNATKFWGENATHCDTAAADGTPGTCNGNGDGIVVESAASVESEMFMFWNQLALSGMITGSYDGITGAADKYDSTPGINMPASKISNTGWSVFSYDSIGHSFFYDNKYKNTLVFGKINPTSFSYAEALSTEEAWGIDKKIDDGLPARGKLIAIYWDSKCSAADDGTNASNDFNASYRLNDSSVQCALMFKDLIN